MASSNAQTHALGGDSFGFTQNSPKTVFFGKGLTISVSFSHQKSLVKLKNSRRNGPLSVVAKKVVGIDLETTNSAVGSMEGVKPVIVTNAEGQPSVVAYTKRHAVVNPERFIGKQFAAEEIPSAQVQRMVIEPEKFATEAIDTKNQADSISYHHRLLHLLGQCSSMSELKQIHAHTLRNTSITHPHTLFLYSRILHFSSLHDLHYAFLFFHTHIENPNSFAWNIIIRACSRSTHRKREAILLYLKMLCEGNVTPDKHSFPFVLKACAYLFAMSEGKQLHGHIVKLGLAADVYINNSLIHLYGSCGSLEDARDVFDEMPERSVVSWNVMIDTLVQLNEFDEAIMCFREMQESFKADSFAIQSILRACAGLGALSLGMWAHAYVLRRCNPEVAEDVLVNNCLLDMYCKCGSLENARCVFERMTNRDVTTWNTMILGFAMHGLVMAALEYLRRMVDEGRLTPNSITFSGVLSACRHSGMVNEGRNYFTIMTTRYGIEPVLEHYGCLVDLLARAGLIAEALDVVSNMTIKPDVVIWRSILDACSKRSMGIEEVSNEMAKKIMESEEGSNLSGAYMLLSRVYAVARKWDEVGAVRKLMADKGVAKEPGCSTIEIDGVAHEFFAGDVSLCQVLNL